MLGKTIAHYEVLSLLGEGGMGQVYRARDTRLGREIAIKLLPAALANDAGRLARFEHEARTVASLNHPNIVTLFSVEDADGIRFLTMELVDGEGLDKHIVSGGLPIDRVIELGTTLCDALGAAHGNGVVHRDLKPANVMLNHEGQLKVLDFGIAKLEQPDTGESLPDAATIAVPVSNVREVVGTIPYMAPEQIRGEPVDGRTDLFSLGILLYELATGKRPFEGKTAGLLSSAILRDDPPTLVSVRTDAPPQLAAVISRCLEKDPRERFQTALEVADALRQIGRADAAKAILVTPPTPSTPLLGREEHLEQAIARIRDGARLLTISGYGGTGKTRFSIELFRRLASEYAGGAAFVSLASVTDAGEVLGTVGSSLEIAEAHGRSALDALCTVIGDNPMLLVLDNLEQVLESAGDIAALAARCPRLQLITTTRAPLKVGAETEFSLPPLDLPGAHEHSLDQLRACPSVALFIQRATRVKPDFELTGANADAVREICRHLDGLPLALELAAARIRILDPDRLLQRLDHALDLLTSGDRDLPLRQRTLRATISWSYSLLEPLEQQLLRRCSVFHEGWTFEAMEQVCYSPDDSWRALDELESLVEKGLVRVIGSGDRYALLETIRAFAAEQLHAGGEVEQIRDAHAAFFRDFTGAMMQEFRGTGQVGATRRIKDDNANELAAIHWMTAMAQQGDAGALESGLLLCGHLDWFWHVAGQHNTARTVIDDLLALAADRPPSRGRGLAYLAAAMVSSATGEWDQALGEWTRGYEDGITIGDDEVASEGCMGLAYTHLSCGRLEETLEPAEEALERSANGVSDSMRSLSLSLKGMLLFQQGEQDEGMRLVEEGNRIQKKVGDCEGGGIALSFLAQMHFARGDLDRSRELYAESLATFKEVGDRPEIARVFCETGWTALSAKDTGAASEAFRQAVLTYEEVGSARGTGLALLGLAAVEAAEGRVERAVTIAEAARVLSSRAGVVCDHPMDPGLTDRIEALKTSIPGRTVDHIVADASELSPAAILTMLDDPATG